jgi:hypothetical protein
MPLAIETDKGQGIRLEATVNWKEIRLTDTRWFNFFNLLTGFTGCPDNGFTYYETDNKK